MILIAAIAVGAPSNDINLSFVYLDGYRAALKRHGIELDNASDGTPLTQNHVLPGDGYTYDFVVTRPGHPARFGALLSLGLIILEGLVGGVQVLRVGLPDRYVTHGKPALLHREVGFTGKAIAERITAAIGSERSLTVR